MNIVEAARASGLIPKTIRYHEEIGLWNPQRRPNGYRHFSRDDVHRLKFLSRARQLDFSLQDCRNLLTSRSSANVREIAARHLAQVEERLADLSQLRVAL